MEQAHWAKDCWPRTTHSEHAAIQNPILQKWTLELEDLEKVFINQATQVNAWDQLLIKNGEKIISLHENVSAVRLDQQRLEHELDFVSAQQSELEEILKPLEASLANAGPVDSKRIYVVNLHFHFYILYLDS